MKFTYFTSIVLAFNSCETIIETLNSIKFQTKRPNQLIINDDYSSDDTISTVENWVKDNKQLFDSIEFIKNKKRNGSVKSLKNALEFAKGDWVKPMAADDVLEINYFEAIREKIMSYKFDILISCPSFINEESKIIDISKNYYYDSLPLLFRIGRPLISYIIKYRMIIPSSTAIFSREVLAKVIDIRFYLIEDWPMWNLIIKSRYKVLYCKKKLLKYRIHDKQITSKPKDEITKNWIKEDLKNFIFLYRNKLSRLEKLLGLLHTIIFLPLLPKKNRIEKGLITLKSVKLLNRIYLFLNKSKDDYILK